jgi:hypothetical protein
MLSHYYSIRTVSSMTTSNLVFKRNMFTYSYQHRSIISLTVPLTIFIPLRFSSKGGPGPIKDGGKILSKGSTPKPLPPSSLKTPGSNEDKPKNYPKPSIPKSSYNHNTYPTLPKEPKSILDNPTVTWAMEKQKQEHDKFIQTQQTNAILLNHIKKPSSSDTNTHSSSHPNTTTSHSEPLTSSTGALVLYKAPLEPAPIENKPVTPFINPKENTFFDKPIPSLPLKPIVKAQPTVPITEDALQKAKSNLKPLIPENTLIPDVSHETPDTVSKIVSGLAITLSQPEVTKEMLDRKLMTKDNAMPIEVMTETGEIIVIGKGTEYKLTAFGYGHFMKANIPLYIENTFNFKKKFDLYVAVINQKENIFQSAAEDKHMLAVFRESDQTWFSPGYLTSQPTPTKLGGMQFKVYQDINYRNLVPNNPNKPQYLALYKNAKKITNDQIILLKGGADYIESLKQTEAITELCKNLMEKDYVNYNSEGITLGQCIATCIHYDTIVKKNLSHPPTHADILNSAKMAAKVAATKNKIKLIENETISE